MQFSEDWPDAVRISSSPDAYAGSWPLSAIKGFLIDLDGTMYTPTGAIDGAKAFHHYLVENDIPYVFCSNTGAKGKMSPRAHSSSTHERTHALSMCARTHARTRARRHARARARTHARKHALFSLHTRTITLACTTLA
eukprot:6179723-Pleurochrysis_carterae.AAC.1